MKEAIAIKESEMLLIKQAYGQLLKSLESRMNDRDGKNIDIAFNMALEGHADQRRKSGEPYILHPIEVSRICSEEIGLGPTAIICALLHDVVEDTDIPLGHIKKTFGERIAMIVDGLTKLDSAYNSQSPQAENFKKVLSTLLMDVRVVLIKMADRLHNMRTLGSMPRHKQLKIAAETSFIYAPLAHRLGLYAIKTELQDLCMKVTDRESYNEIAKKLQATKRERNHYIEEFLAPLRKHLDQLGINYRIAGRPKSIFSIWNKIKTKKVPFDEIYDLFAVRIIINAPIKSEKSLCWQVYSIVTDVHTPIPERLKDWVTTPKSNGYESLHTTVIGPGGRFVEVQIRSERMDEIAERGFAAHWKYKGVINQPDTYDKWLDNVREILENQESDAIEFINDFKTNLFNEEVYVYTPRGDMKILPKGATALDFAFSIHTDIGYHCKAVKINNKLVPMGYKLQNGDQIHVTTDKNQKPNEDWIKMVVTGKARAKIRTALNEEKKRIGEYGKESLMRKLKNIKANFDENIEMLLSYFNYKSGMDFYFDIANDNFDLAQLKIFTVEGHKLVPPVVKRVFDEEQLPKAAESLQKLQQQGSLTIDGQPASMYNFSFATCCNPLPGDEVFAYITANTGTKVHRVNCPNATHLSANYAYRIMKAEWTSNTNNNFIAELLITGIDEGVGVIEKLTNKISSMLGLNIRSFYIDGNEGYFEGKIKLQVINTNQLNMAINSIKQLEGISNVTRIN